MEQSSRGCAITTSGFRQALVQIQCLLLCTGRLVLPLHLLICISVCVLQLPFTTAKLLFNPWVSCLALPVKGA